MRRLIRSLSILVIVAMILPMLPAATKAADPASLYEDDFAGGLGNWDLFGSAAWQVQGTGTEAQLQGSTSLTGPQRAVVKQTQLPYTAADYNLEFTAQGDRFRTMFRYSSSTSYYFLEFKNASYVELWKYPNSSATEMVGAPVNIGAVLPGFNLTDWHQYRIEVKGAEFKLYIDNSLVTVFSDASLLSGGIGFSLKSLTASTAVYLNVEQVSVKPVAAATDPYSISHTPMIEVPYNADVPVAFTVANATASATALIHYGYGDDSLDLVLQPPKIGEGVYSGVIPGSNRTDKIRYFIAVQDEEGNAARYPESGEVVVAVGQIEPYLNNFDAVPANTVPADWTVGGNTRVVELSDGNKVLNLNGSGSAKLNLPVYQNVDNFIAKFKVKYARTSDAVQNTWRFRYRATDDANNNAMEWATHNSKYFIMRKTTLGGNYYVANYVKSLLDEWHEYELRVSGITHKLFIDGVEIASGEDSDALAPIKGYFQWNVVGGINLMIDDFSIEPMQSPFVVDLQPSGNYAGIYTQDEVPSLALALDSGSQAHVVQMDYTVNRADGAREIVASGTKSYPLAAYASSFDVLPFDPQLYAIGTYEVSTDFIVDGAIRPDLSKRMRLAVIKNAAPIGELDLDNESKFGLNTHYALNWKDDIIDGARKMGARHHRSGISWEDVDRNVKDLSGAPIYDYSRVEPQLDKLFSYGFNQITVLSIDKNANYQSGTINRTDSLKAMGDFVTNVVAKYKDRIRQWEMPNEPEIFSKPYIPAEFVQLQKIAYLNMKKADPNAMLLAGDHTSSVLSVLPKELELGSYDYADAYSYHPYVYNSMPDGNLQNLVNAVKGLVDAYGGWKDYYLTEGGWPTAKSGYPSVSEEVQRDYIVRAFLNYMITDQVKAYEYYDYKNDGTDDRYYDIFWGITDNNGRPKLAYAAVNQLMTQLDKARYIGTWDTGNPDVAVHLFLNDGQPVLTAWKKVDHKDNPAIKPPTATLTLPFGAAGVQVTDINGVDVPVSEAAGRVQLNVSGSPVYVTGAPAEFVFQAAAKLLQDKKQEAVTKLNRVQTVENAALIADDVAEIERIAAQFETVAGNGDQAAELEQGIRSVYSLMSQIAGQIENGSIEGAPGYVALEALYNWAESASVALVYALSGIGANSLDYSHAAEAAAAVFHAKKGDYNVMPVSESAVLRLNRYGRLAETAFARGSYAESYAYNLLAREFAGTVETMVGSEPAKFIGVLANVTPTQVNGEAGYTTVFNLSFVNSTNAPQPVTVHIKLPDGWEAAQTELDSLDLTIPAQSELEQVLQVLVPEGTVKGRYELEFTIVHNGSAFDTKKVELTVEEGLAAKLLPVKQTIENLDVVSVVLTGTSSAEKAGEVTLKGPDGTLLEPVASSTFSGLKKGDRIQLDFRWTYRQPAAFNAYFVDLQVNESASGKVIFHDEAMPLDFNLIQSSGDITVDGNLQDWSDAYPVHLRRNDQNAAGFHDPNGLEATAYAKWTDDGMYFAIAVRDNVHKQSENAANLWKNDSIQISLDPLNRRESPYGAADTEWGFALGDDGRHLVNIFYSAPPNPNGDVSGQVPFEAIRDEAAGMTYYELMIPGAYVKDLGPALGQTIGFNVAVNDADYQNGRDNFIQWTQGTADSKSPALYDRFEFIDHHPSTPGGGEGEGNGGNGGGNPSTTPPTSGGNQPPASSGSVTTTEPETPLKPDGNGTNTTETPANPAKEFSDLKPSHWAYAIIRELAEKQIVQGTSAGKFEPNRTITRAEFAAMLVKALKLTKTGVMPFGDVPADKWYAEAVSIAYEAGIVNGTGAATFNPNGNITREQMVVMTMKAYRMIGGRAMEDTGAAFTDAAQISGWAVEDVQEAAALGLVRGRASGRFIPKGNSTRAEAAQVIYNLING
ncbi:S-layer homology domain-containing protein [Cohnella phaseoli]|uniref:S-layer family protein n=1 Tax=Cohnella phaseoli TaxID=456490 RepID=A0A3D9IAE9_9BACL|nr:S-layer homology domain-containing protein [Cohnella phaseoli]RED58176.1 S-layer family protein [Cohnella phaseoli]